VSDVIQNNVSEPGKRYFGLHFAEGVAQYTERGKGEYKVFLNQDTINKMDSTFEGKPVYVGHRSEIDLKNVDGWVIKSFFNKSDGKNWVEFIAITDAAKEAIAKGYKLSNAYIVKSTTSGDKWHGVEYEKQVMDGEYEHLALVPDPRYAESIILTPKEFKEYNASKEVQLSKLQNSLKEVKSMFSFWKKSKVENGLDADVTVTLPKSGKEVLLSTVINEADEMAVSMNAGMAHPKSMVNMGSESITVEGLMSKHTACMNELDALKKEKEASAKPEEKKENEEPRKQFDKDGQKKENEEEDKDKKKEEEKGEKKENAIHFDALKNAEATAAPQGNDQPAILNALDYGKQLYGSK